MFRVKEGFLCASCASTNSGIELLPPTREPFCIAALIRWKPHSCFQQKEKAKEEKRKKEKKKKSKKRKRKRKRRKRKEKEKREAHEKGRGEEEEREGRGRFGVRKEPFRRPKSSAWFKIYTEY